MTDSLGAPRAPEERAKCPTCHGKGFAGGAPYPCPTCNGRGDPEGRDAPPPSDPIAPLLDELRTRIQAAVGAFNTLQARTPDADDGALAMALVALERMIPSLARFRKCDALRGSSQAGSAPAEPNHETFIGCDGATYRINNRHVYRVSDVNCSLCVARGAGSAGSPEHGGRPMTLRECADAEDGGSQYVEDMVRRMLGEIADYACACGPGEVCPAHVHAVKVGDVLAGMAALTAFTRGPASPSSGEPQ